MMKVTLLSYSANIERDRKKGVHGGVCPHAHPFFRISFWFLGYEGFSLSSNITAKKPFKFRLTIRI